MDEQTAYIGGGTHKGPESLWQYDGGGLVPVPLPAGIGAAGKGLDHLFIDGDRLVAVDDIVVPKFILTYRLDGDRPPVAIAAERLEAHSSCERVIGGATGRSVFALYSRAINHGTSTAHLSILSKTSLREVGCYSVTTSRRMRRMWDIGLPEWWRRPWDVSEPRPKHGLEDGPLDRRPSMAFVNDTLVLGTDVGVFAAEVGGLAEGSERPRFEQVEAAGGGKVLDVQAVGSAGCVVALAEPDAELRVVTGAQLREAVTVWGRPPRWRRDRRLIRRGLGWYDGDGTMCGNRRSQSRNNGKRPAMGCGAGEGLE
jgi:hypothetical protein